MAYQNWRVLMDMPIIGYDRLDGEVAGSWGTTRAGLPWSHTGGTVGSEYYVTGGSGVQEHNAVNVLHQSVLDIDSEDWELGADVNFTIGQALGASVTAWICGGYSDVNNYYIARLTLATSGSVSVALLERNGGSLNSLTDSITVGTNTAGMWWRVVFSGTARSNGGQRAVTMSARAWVPATDSDPSRPMLYFDDTSPLPGGQSIAVMSRLETGNSNTQPVRIRWRDVSASAPRRMVDITQYVDTINSPMSLVEGSTAETDGNPGGATLILNNSGQRFTPGNINSPYWPNMRPARRVEISEVIGYDRTELFAGPITFPEIESWTESTEAAPRDQTIAVSLADTLTDVDRAPAFVSTLAAHILAANRGSLIDYWPMQGPISPLPNLVSPSYGLVSTLSLVNGVPVDQPPTFQGQTVAPGDDISTVQVGLETNWFSVDSRPTIPISTSDILTIGIWYQFNVDVDHDANLVVLNGFSANLTVQLLTDPIHFDFFTGGFAGSVDGPTTPAGSPVFLMARARRTPALAELWVNGVAYTGVPVGSDSNFVGYNQVQYLGVGLSAFGSTADLGLAHVQIYIGDEGVSPTWDDYLAQYEVGLFGLEGQTTGQRVATIAGYAGIPSTDLAAIDPGVTAMQRATLAGFTATAAISEAVETEQGHLGVRGDGLIEFHDRRRIYNI